MKLFDKISDGFSNILLPVSNETIKVVVLCVVTATTFWFFNALNDNYTTRISYPVQFTYPDSGLVVVKELPDNVKINVSGGGWNLLRKTFWFTIDPVEIPLENPVNDDFFLGTSLYANIADQLNEIQLNFIETDTLWVDIDSVKAQKSKILFDSSSVKLAQNYRIISPIKISIDSATFKGPSRYIETIPENIYLKTNKENIDKNFKEDITFSTYGSSLVNRNPVEAEVSFQVAKFIEQELMLPYDFINVPADSSKYNFGNDLAVLKFDIQEQLASQYSLDSFKVVIDFATIKPADSITYPQILNVPEQINQKSIQVSPISIKYLKE